VAVPSDLSVDIFRVLTNAWVLGLGSVSALIFKRHFCFTFTL